jgi:hypothetical protein
VVVGSKYVTEGIQQYLYAMNASHDERFDVRKKIGYPVGLSAKVNDLFNVVAIRV